MWFHCHVWTGDGTGSGKDVMEVEDDLKDRDYAPV